MEPKCPFLKVVEGEDRCEIAINFFWVGKGRWICRLCPIPELLAQPRCRHLEIYPVLCCGEEKGFIVRPVFACDLMGWGVDFPEECAHCPHYEKA